jgi:hypothetical protein
LAIAIVSLSVSSLRAHHSFAAEFDANKPITLKGTVVKMDWVNPHSWIHLDVKNADGTVTRWMIEGGTPNTLVRRGFTKNSLLPGTEITIEGYPRSRQVARACVPVVAVSCSFSQPARSYLTCICPMVGWMPRTHPHNRPRHLPTAI